MATPIICSDQPQALEGTYPLAAVLLRRAMINDTLDRTKSARDRHAARHLAERLSLDSAIPDYADIGDHAAFLALLQNKHQRKEGFWGWLEVLGQRK